MSLFTKFAMVLVALVLLGTSSAWAWVPPPNPATALARAEKAHRETATTIEKRRREEASFCKTIACRRDTDALVAAELDLNATAVEFYLSDLHPNKTDRVALFTKWKRKYNYFQTLRRRFRRKYSKTAGSVN